MNLIQKKQKTEDIRISRSGAEAKSGAGGKRWTQCAGCLTICLNRHGTPPGSDSSAPQVGVWKSVIVIDTHDEEEGEAPRPLFLVNPEIIARSEEKICHEEGCLSVPDQHAEVMRFAEVRVRYLDYHGEASGSGGRRFAGDCLATWNRPTLMRDLYIDRISRLKRQMLLKKLKCGGGNEEWKSCLWERRNLLWRP